MSVFLLSSSVLREVVMPIALIVHGGAWAIPDEYVEPHIAGCRAALASGWAILEQGGSALDAVEAAVRLMEDDPTFDAGTGSVLTSAGTVELDAMELWSMFATFATRSAWPAIFCKARQQC
jgi:isoaspartyl peptidase/L-asparaginase-like protein (Ntn-hydrolase superfamily)